MTLLDDVGAPDSAAGAWPQRFTVRLHNFEGPFDLLLQQGRVVLDQRHRARTSRAAMR